MLHSFNCWARNLFFNQPYALERVALLRVLTVAIALLMLAYGPYDSRYHIDAGEVMYRAKFPFFFLPSLGQLFATVKFVAIAAGLVALIGLYTSWAMPLFTISYCLLNFVIHAYQDHYCMNQAHLNFILVALCFAKTNTTLSIDALQRHRKELSDTDSEYASWVLTFAGAFIAALLFQTGLSKLIYGGIGWFTSGDTLYVETILDGTAIGRRLTGIDTVFPLIGMTIAIFELGFPWLFLSRKYHFIMGVSLLAFHLGTFIVMGISFWFLWPLYFPTFLGVRIPTRSASIPAPRHIPEG